MLCKNVHSPHSVWRRLFYWQLQLVGQLWRYRGRVTTGGLRRGCEIAHPKSITLLNAEDERILIGIDANTGRVLLVPAHKCEMGRCHKIRDAINLYSNKRIDTTRNIVFGLFVGTIARCQRPLALAVGGRLNTCGCSSLIEFTFVYVLILEGSIRLLLPARLSWKTCQPQ